jgi:hypothetical protein
LEDRQVLTMMHLFGIGQAYKPYLTNMRQRVVATHIYKAYRLQYVDRAFHPICCINMPIGIFSYLLHSFATTFEASFHHMINWINLRTFEITILIFNAKRRGLTMMHLFGIGQGYKPYPTNMRQRVTYNTYI